MVSRQDAFRATAAVALACLLLAPTGTVAAAQPADSTVADTDEATVEGAVTFVRTVEEMKGHLTVSVSYARANDTDLAAHHANHPHEEYWRAINATLSDVNATLASDLERTLLAAPDHARDDEASAYAAWVNDTLFALLDDAERAVAGERTTDAAFNAKVSRDLLQRAVQEYGEGVTEDGTVTEQMEYDDALGFVARADALYRAHVRATLSEHASEELDELFETLHGSVNDAVPPADLTSVTNGIAAEYAEYTGIESETDGSAVETTVAEIEEHLHEAVDAYANGDADEANEIIRQTYLSYFEGLEGELIEKRPELVEELEAAFNEDLPGLIERNASVSEVREKVESMEAALDEVEEALAADSGTTISLGDDTTTTSADTTTASDDSGSSGSTPGFGVGAAFTAVLAAALLAVRRSN
ncbi:PGF-CTERM sorting domain-containing protein [Salarchaeum japonicum]|uniref:PGF-CTERM sorting domain-containing protein n=1 Tax=Salarchaeum japonicum TaxID=555573 RepID=UPI003C7308CF